MSGEEKDEPSGLELAPPSGVDEAGLGLGPSLHPRFDPSEVFRKHHESLRAALADHPHPGFLAGVIHDDNFATTWVAATEDRVRAAIIGRHTRATLPLPRTHATAALRHLALLVRAEGPKPVARLLDLQTEIGFADPLGRRVEAIRTDGITFLSAGGAVLVLAPTGRNRGLDSDPETAWASIPPQRWVESRRGHASVEAPSVENAAHETTIEAQDGPRGCRSALCRAHEIPVGLATVAAGTDETYVRVSGRALDEGFLIGRYDRCEVGGPEADESLSRVHLLVVREGQRIIAVDTASTNGTYIGEDRVHLVDLEERTRLDLGGVLDLTWHICN
ncbi:MAG: FHA domain-containing protein [Myxococcota bacterium]